MCSCIPVLEEAVKATLDLRENPFDPLIEGLGKIGNQSLDVDRHPDLERLLSVRAGGMDRLIDDVSYALFGDDGPTAPVSGSMILLLLGERGSGRSTMAAMIRKLFAAQDEVAPEQWKRFDLCFDPFDPTPSPAKVDGQFQALRDRLTKAFGDKPGYVLVFIDNVPAGWFNNVMSVFAAFPHVRRVFIATSDEPDLWDRDLDAAGPRIEKVILRKLGTEDTREFMFHRLQQFRAGALPQAAIDDFPLFPFDVSAPETAVGVEGKSFSRLNAWLRKRIDAKHLELIRSEAVDIAAADLNDLRMRLIP
jgi:hypothetical protein